MARSYLNEGDKAAQAVNDPVPKDTLAAARAGYARDGERKRRNAVINRRDFKSSFAIREAAFLALYQASVH